MLSKLKKNPLSYRNLLWTFYVGQIPSITLAWTQAVKQQIYLGRMDTSSDSYFHIDFVPVAFPFLDSSSLC